MTDFLRAQLETYFIEKPAEAGKIADQVLINKRSREHAEKTRATIKKALSIQSDMANRVEKFVDCRSKDPEKRELFIVEGDSALGSVKLGRDADFQAIMPVRGKILNCLKADYERIFKSQIITDLVRVLGCGVELGGKYKSKDISTFNIDNCRFKKIIFCTDADVDGLAIQCLLSVMFYRLMPSLIREGYVYIVESPLYEITTKDNTYFAFDEVERREILKKIGRQKYTIQRSKGLGENEPEMMWKTTMNPETRRLRCLTFENAQQVAETYDLFMGDDLEGRKNYIAEHGSEYMDDLDIS
jgi:DNA gyrase subunit B